MVQIADNKIAFGFEGDYHRKKKKQQKNSEDFIDHSLLLLFI